MHTLAVELIQLIALHLATPSSPQSSTPRPPKDLISLLATSRSLYAALNPYDNPYLYAEIFRRTFDTSALYRRFPADRLTAPALTHELKRRWSSLSRIRILSAAPGYYWTPRQYRKHLLLEDLMTLYVLFTESDGPNAKLVLQYGNVMEYLEQFKYNIVDKLRVRPEMPEENEEMSLWLWLCWFTLDYYKTLQERDGYAINFDYLITPFVLGVFQYANTFAPWTTPIMSRTMPSLPSSSFSLPSQSQQVLTNPSPSPFELVPCGPRPLSTAIPGGYLSIPAGSTSSHGTNGISFSFPLVHHAAVQLCLAREDCRPIFEHGAPNVSDNDLLNAALGQGYFPSASTLVVDGSQPFMDYRTGQVPRIAYTPDYMRLKFACIVDSRRWDNDWARLVACSPQRPIPLPSYRWTPGRMSGVWDGRFMIPVLEGYHRLLAALQPPTPDDDDDEEREYPVNILEEVHRLRNFQSWSLVEYHHRPLLQLPNALRPGRAVNAHLPEGMIVERTAESWDPNMKRWRNGLLVTSNGVTSFYEAIPPSDVHTTALPPSTSGLPILVFGNLTTPPQATSTATTFFQNGTTISGIVRPWDGLITLKATGDARAGDFVYNGYLVGEGEESGNWVGRWRDANSEAERVAWEGVFTMRKRGE